MNIVAKRLWEVDTARGFAIVLMVFYHFIWDLYYFDLYQADLMRGPWQIFARSIATTFIFVMGVSLTLSYRKAGHKLDSAALAKKYIGRGAKIFGWGMLITAATYLFIGRGFVIFGILHLLGFSIIIAYPFLGRSQWLSLLMGLLIIGAGIYADRLVVSHPWLIWLGIKQRGIFMVDYYPVLPWAGIAFLGIFTGRLLYPAGGRRLSLPDLSGLAPVQALSLLGRHSLLIYLVHQPVLIGSFILLGFGSF